MGVNRTAVRGSQDHSWVQSSLEGLTELSKVLTLTGIVY